MPLLDHFHPPLSRTHPWRSFHGALATLTGGSGAAALVLADESVAPPSSPKLEAATWRNRRRASRSGGW